MYIYIRSFSIQVLTGIDGISIIGLFKFHISVLPYNMLLLLKIFDVNAFFSI